MNGTKRLQRFLSFCIAVGRRDGEEFPAIRWFAHGNRIFAYTDGASFDFPGPQPGNAAYGTIVFEQLSGDDGPFKYDVVLRRSHRLKRDAIEDARDLYRIAVREDGLVASPGRRAYDVACGTCGADQGVPDRHGRCTAC